MSIKKNDFVEIEFIGKIKETGEVFDTNIEKEAKKAGLDLKNLKPFIFSVGHKMLPLGLDKDIIGKEIGKDYIINLNPEDAFGKRNPGMVKMIPTKLFHEQNIDPQRGTQLNLDGQLARVLSSSSGRTLVDFNNPLAGKVIIYDYKINRSINEEKEKIDSLQEFLFRKKFDFDITENILTFKVPKEIEQFVNLFATKLEEILGLKIKTKVSQEKKKD